MQANDATLFMVTDGTQTTSINSDAFEIRNQTMASIESTWDVTTPTSVTTVPGTLEVDTLTFPDKATAVDGDYFTATDHLGVVWACALAKNAFARKTLTFSTKSATVAGTAVVFYDAAGQDWAFWLDKTGTDTVPVNQAYVNVATARKARVDISADSTAAQVAARVETAINALTGFTTSFTSDDSAADGTMIIDCDAPGPVDSMVICANVAGVGSSVSSADTTDGALTAEPPGPIWVALAADHKTTALIDACSTAATVAAAVELAFDLLGSAIATDDAAADGSMTFTQAEPINVANPVPYSADESGVGTITVVATTPGVGGVSITEDTFYHAAHGLATGVLGRLTTGTTLPAGLALSTDYYVIAVSADKFAFGSTLAHAQAGTKVNITGRGTGTHTFTPTALSASTKIQKSNDGVNWVDLDGTTEVLTGSNSQTISADGSYVWSMPVCPYRYLRQSVTIAAGQMTLSTSALAK